MISNRRRDPRTKREIPLKDRQVGAATLFVTIIMLALLTVIAAVSAKIGMFELKTSANTNRAKEALYVAQGGLDYGAVRYFDDASWAGESLEMPYGGPGASVSVSATVDTDSVLIQAEGESLDETGLARVEEKYARVPVAHFGELPPLMANGNFPDNGSFSIITKPNGGGPGVPVSGWATEGTKQGAASWQTCNVDEWLYEGNNESQTKYEQSDGFTLCHTCRCDKADNPICDAKDVSDADECPDLVIEADVPDVFTQLFGIDPDIDDNGNGRDDWYDRIDSIAMVRLTSCGSLDASIGEQFYGNGANAGMLPIIWVEGDCNVPSAEVASYDAPIILFVHGDLTINSNTRFYGIAFGFSDRYGYAPNAEDYTVTVNGGPTVYGVLLTNQQVDNPTGNFAVVYSEGVLKKLANAGDTFYELTRYPGSWTDTQ